jgi:hypothetical protein
MDEGEFALGEVSFHSGWTFHRAGGNRTGRMRQVFTIKYMDAGMRLADREEAERKSRCWHEFSPGVQPGEPLATRLNPLLYAGTATSKGTA